MKTKPIFLLIAVLFFNLSYAQDNQNRDYLEAYSGAQLDYIAFPIGGLGAGMICMEGCGAISHVSIFNKPDIFNEPYAYAAIMVKGLDNGAKVLQTQVPGRKVFGGPGTGNGLGNQSYGLPRFEKGEFTARFPFASLKLIDNDIPIDIEVTGWSPFIPTDEDNSSLPVAIMEYRFRNTGQNEHEAVFSWNSKNILTGKGAKSIVKSHNGFTCRMQESEENSAAWFRAFVDDDNALVNACWFRGGWWDANTISWKNVEEGLMPENPEIEGNAPGASIYVPFSLDPGEEKTIRLHFCWYVPGSTLKYGNPEARPTPAFYEKPSEGTAPSQQEVSGFIGKGLVNTYDPEGDMQTGTLTSPEFTINKKYLKFLVGGGSNKGSTCVQVLVGDEVVFTATGNNTENLQPVTCNLQQYQGKKAKIQILDQASGGWGHILADQFVLTGNENESLSSPGPSAIILMDFEGGDYNGWTAVNPEPKTCCPGSECGPEDPYYKPWYAGKFKSIDDLTNYIRMHFDDLRSKSALFRDAFYSSSLPPEVIESVAANLTILKSPTVLRQTDGRMWAWEGCSDASGCCAGSCTHVWNYAQAIPHLFPKLERTLRETEFLVSQDSSGHQVFRSGLPIQAVQHTFHAASDGQLGGIMKVYRDWRISGDNEWMKKLYPKVKESMDYCIRTWDPKGKGILEEPHHNTYDIEFWGPEGMCTSFYLGALTAIAEIGRELGYPFEEYENLLMKGKKFMEDELFDGEYFIQKIQWEGLEAPNPVEFSQGSWTANYSDEARELLQEEGPKYQYGKGCLSDGVLGMWMASVSGLDEIIDNEKITSHLVSIHKYNLRDNLLDHANPQRPTFACGDDGGLLLCSWPKGGKLTLPFVYSDEVWTGIEYQVASHLMFKGETEKGLDIVREVRDRYNGKKRNPFNEYECGHWYARAMSSYGMLQGLTGVRYDAVKKTLYIDSKVGDNFTSFLSTETGFGNVGLKNGEPFVDVKYGYIDVDEIVTRDSGPGTR